MTRYIIIDNCSGYVILDTANIGGTTFHVNDPLVACRLHDSTRSYQIVNTPLLPRAVGYRVYRVDDGVPVIRDPHHLHLIELVETECSLVANVQIVS